MASTPVEFFFDIACPWTWITARWVADVAPQRDLDVTWRTYSLAIRNRGKELPPEIKAKLDALYRGLRVIEAARERHGDDMAGRLYTEFGSRIHHDGDDRLAGLADGLAAVGADADLAKAADDTAWDAVLEANTARGVALVGDDVGVPIVYLPDDEITFFGPVMSPAPTGAAAARLWDAYLVLREFDGVYEIKRHRAVGPQFGPRPVAA